MEIIVSSLLLLAGSFDDQRLDRHWRRIFGGDA